MELTVIDFILTMSLSLLAGVAIGLTLCCRYKETFLQRSKSTENLSQYNHQRLVYPQESPIVQATAPQITEIKLSQT